MPVQYDSSNLVVHPVGAANQGLIVDVQPDSLAFRLLHFQVRTLDAGQTWPFSTDDNEAALIMLGGQVNVASNRGNWERVGGRADVFSGLPHALYLPRQTNATVVGTVSAEFAVAWVATDQDHDARLVTPSDVWVEIRGGDHATRQINSILPPGFPCSRLVVVEVYTPGGNWSSYPPHKHDIHKVDVNSRIVEADLDEVYYYRFERPEGYAFQRIYTDAESPLHRAGHPIDSTVMPHNHDVVLVPEGYHPVSAPPGYTTYYLNVLAGSAQSLAATDDPQYAWVKGTYRTRDPRVPVYDVSQSAGIR